MWHALRVELAYCRPWLFGAWGIAIGFAFFILDRASLAIGEAGLVPPSIAGWAPSLALAAIAVIGVEYGLLAFVVGLSITGWVETARYVREQTQLVKGNVPMESHCLQPSSRTASYSRTLYPKLEQ